MAEMYMPFCKWQNQQLKLKYQQQLCNYGGSEGVGMSKIEFLNCLLLATCNWYRQVVNFHNVQTKQKWHALNPPINKET